MNVLITGGYGFIGSHVAESFHLKGWSITILDDLSTGRSEYVTVPHRFFRFKAEDPSCEAVFSGVQYDTVVHLAAQTDVQTSIHHPALDARSNILGLVNMLELSVKYKARTFIFASSAAVYGNNPDVPLTELADCRPLSPYGLNKHTGERYCRLWSDLYGLRTVCLRFSNVYGPKQGNGGEGGVVSIFMNRIRSRQPLLVFGDGEQTRDFIYVEDVAEGIRLCAESGHEGIFNLSGGKGTSINELIRILRKNGPVKEIVHQPLREGDIVHSILDNAAIIRDLQWKPRHSFHDGLKKTAAWFSADL